MTYLRRAFKYLLQICILSFPWHTRILAMANGPSTPKGTRQNTGPA